MFEKFLVSSNNVVTMYAILHNKEEDKFIIKKVGLIPATKDNLKEKIIEKMKERKEYTIKKLEDYEEKNDVFWEVQIDQSNKIKNLLEQIESSSIDEYDGNFSDVYGLLYKIKNVDSSILWQYKQNYSINFISDKGLSLMLKRMKVYEILDKSIFRLNIDSDFYILKENGIFRLLVNNLKVIERNFGIQEVIKRKALENVDEIEKLGLIRNIDTLKEKLNQGEMKFTRKLMRLKKESPVFKLKRKEILEFVKNDEIVKKVLKIGKNEEGKEIILVASEKEKDMFIRLLNDDFLHSRLTNIPYLSNSKDLGNEI